MSAKVQYLLYVVVVVLAGVFYLIGILTSSGEQRFEWLIFSAFISLVSVAFFLRGSYRFREKTKADATIRWAFRLSCACLVLGLLQIPLWYIFARLSPNLNLTQTEASVASGSTLISIFGPALPWQIYFIRFMRSQNQQQREMLKQRKKERDNL